MGFGEWGHLDWFSGLDSARWERLGIDGGVQEFAAGEVIFRAGDPPTHLFIVLAGQLEVYQESDVITHLYGVTAGEVVGEQSVLTGEPHTVTVRALEAVRALRLEDVAVRALCMASPEFARRLLRTVTLRAHQTTARRQVLRRQTEVVLGTAPTAGARRFELVGRSPGVDAVRAAIAHLADSVAPVVVSGEVGVGKEQVAYGLHVSGRRRDGPFVTLAAANWSPEQWERCVRLAAHGTLVLRGLERLPPEALPALQALLPAPADATPGGDAPAGAAPSPAGAAPSPAGAAPAGSMVEPSRPRLVATWQVVDDAPQPPPPGAILLRQFGAERLHLPPLRLRRLDIPDLVHHFLAEEGYFEPGAPLPVTTGALSLLQAHSYLEANIRELRRILVRAMLLARGRWLEPEHLTLRGPRAGGRPIVGLALGGGLVRGIVHIGVLQALRDQGVPVHLLAGTSSGAFVGAMFAAGVSPERIRELASGLRWAHLAELAWPRSGLMTNNSLGSWLEAQLGRLQFSELKLPFAAVAADINSGDEVVVRTGALATAVRASSAIPGLFEPVAVDGRLLVDGAVVNNVPASVCRRMGADIVLAVDITQYTFQSGAPRGIGVAMMRALDILTRHSVAAGLEWADVVIRPDVSRITSYRFQNVDQMVQLGYEATLAAMDRIRLALSPGG